MEAYLSKACWRAGAKLVAGFAVIGAVVGIRIVTATPTGLDSDLEQLERLEAELAAGPASEGDRRDGGTVDDLPSDAAVGATDPALGASEGRPSAAVGVDLDRMVRCRLAGGTQFMRAADCATRGGGLEELPPPEPEDPTSLPTTP